MISRGQSLVVGPTLLLSGDHKPPLSRGSVNKNNSLAFKGDKKIPKFKGSKKNLLTLVDCSDSEILA